MNAVRGFFTVIVQQDDEIEDSDDPKVIIARVNDGDIRRKAVPAYATVPKLCPCEDPLALSPA